MLLSDIAIVANILLSSERDRASAEAILYALYLYSLDLLHKYIQSNPTIHRRRSGTSHVAVWKWFKDSILNVFTFVREYLPF
jgi:hypothetical protein